MILNAFNHLNRPIRFCLHLFIILVVFLTECLRSDARCPEMPNFFLPASDLERSMKAIYDIRHKLPVPVAAKVSIFYILHAFC